MHPNQRIEQQLLDRLASSAWREGDVFLSEGAVAEEFAVSRATAQKALHALRQKGYLTSRQGKGYIVCSPTAHRPTYTIGMTLFVSAHFNHPVTMARMAGFQEALIGTPYAIKTFIQHENTDRAGFQLNMDEEYTPAKLDGLNTGIGDLSIERMRALSREMVIVCNNWFEPDRRWSYVQFDYMAAFATAIRHLIELGHKHIALLHAVDDMGYWSQWRPDYPRMSRLAAEAARAGVYLEAVRVADHTEEQGGVVAEHLLTRDERPTAVVCSDDLALGVYRATERLGLAIPDDLSLVAMNDLLPADALPRPLSAVRLDYALLGRAAGEEFLRMLADPAALGREVLLSHELMPRATSGPPPRITKPCSQRLFAVAASGS